MRLYYHNHSGGGAIVGVFVLLLPILFSILFAPLSLASPSILSEFNSPKPRHLRLLESAILRQTSNEQQSDLWMPLSNQGWKPCVEPATSPSSPLPENSQGYVQVFLDGGLNQQRMGVKGLLFNWYSWLTTHNAFAQLKAKSATGAVLLAPENQQDTVTSQLNNLHRQGARAFWIHNTGSIGCLPFFIVNYPPKAGNADQHGCVKSYNDLAQEFNKQLKDKIFQLRMQLQDVFIPYVDIYSAKYALIDEAKKYGLVSSLGYCCGHYGYYRARCGCKSVVNGSEIYGASCSNPLEYLSWDGIHYSEAANKRVANLVLDGSLSDPPVAISEACYKPAV